MTEDQDDPTAQLAKQILAHVRSELADPDRHFRDVWEKVDHPDVVWGDTDFI